MSDTLLKFLVFSKQGRGAWGVCYVDHKYHFMILTDYMWVVSLIRGTLCTLTVVARGGEERTTPR